MSAAEPRYQSGFGNEFASEAEPGALPKTQNAPQQAPLGLYVEELNGTSFTAPRGMSRSSWTYRIRPSTMSLTKLNSRVCSPFVVRTGTPFRQLMISSGMTALLL